MQFLMAAMLSLGVRPVMANNPEAHWAGTETGIQKRMREVASGISLSGPGAAPEVPRISHVRTVARSVAPMPNADAVLETSRMSVVFKRAQALSSQGKTVLAVFDLDNTLISPETQLGTDPWFETELEKLEKWKTRANEALFNKRRQQLVDLQYGLFKMMRFHPTEEGLPAGMRALHKIRNIKTIGLTAREASWCSMTLDHLDFQWINVSDGADGELFEERRSQNMFKGPVVMKRPLGYAGGILCLDRQHKGESLLIFLRDRGFWPDAVVFADDKPKNVEQVVEALKKTSIELWAYRYSAEDPRVRGFLSSQEQQEIAKIQLYYFKTFGRLVDNGFAWRKIGEVGSIVPHSLNTNLLIYGVEDPSKP